MDHYAIAEQVAPQRAVGHLRPRASLFTHKPVLFWILHLGGWAALGVAMYAWALSYQTPTDALVNKLLLTGIGCALTLGARRLYRVARLRKLAALHTSLLVVTCVFFGAVVWREAHYLCFQAYLAIRESTPLDLSLAWIPIGTLLYDGFVLLAWSLLYYTINGSLELEEQSERLQRAEYLAHTARLKALQSQLEPHFLFNTLNSISTLVAEGDGLSARNMIARLSDFLRMTLEKADTAEIFLADELEFVRRYLDIQQVRFGSRLQVAIDVPSDLQRAVVPTLLLQPLVENAVKHGILPREAGGSLQVTGARSNGTLRLSVTDDGGGLPAVSQLPDGHGLAITRARLLELYGNAASLQVQAAESGGVAAHIDLPYRTAEGKVTT